MPPLSPADVADAGLVRLGAGIRAPRPFSLPLPSRAPGHALNRPGQQPAVPPMPAVAARVPAMVADSGRVRLGAGIRRV